jgi:hypothetical protein
MRRIVLSCVLLLGLPGLSNASQILIGLDWRQNVFIQEYWQDGKPRYAIYNNRAENLKITVSDLRFVTPPGTERFQAVEGKELASWEFKGKGVLFVDAPMVPAGHYLRFRIAGGAQLGTLSSPTSPTNLPKGKIVSNDGINGSGSRRQNVVYQQDALTFKSDGVIEVQLRLSAGGETITFKKTKGTETPVEALISEARCETLSIKDTNEAITIDVSKPLKEAAVHTVTLKFKAPKVDTSSMAVIDGWVTVGGGGYHLIRGVVLQPGK